MDLPLAVLSALVATAWLPIIYRFYRDYVRRPEDERHPASLAIVSAMSVMVFHALAGFVIEGYGWRLTRLIVLSLELLVVAQFWYAFRVGQKRPLVRRDG